ncbi:MAG: 2'-5' RNA ligase family protein [Bryobacteraceae bacterium]
MLCDPTRRERINSFALVSYIPDPLAAFLDDLRQELVPTCFLRAHISILPPRVLSVPPDEAWRHICALAPMFSPVDAQLTDVQVFPVSNVIYLALGTEGDRVTEMHAVLNSNGLEKAEPFEFVPHVTLAQDLQPGEVDSITEAARERWDEYKHQRWFRLETITFVQNTEGNNWIDLGECRLGTGDVHLLEPLALK